MPAPERLSACVITYNRAQMLETCLRAVRFADEVVVVDKSSTDGTEAIAHRYADKYLLVPWTPTVEETRAFAVSMCGGDNVLLLDDDELLSPEAIAFIARDGRAMRHDVYYIPMRHYVLGRHDEGAWYWPDGRYALFRKGRVTFSTTVHGGVSLESQDVHSLSAADGICIHHLSHADVAQWIEKTNRYTSRPDRISHQAETEDLLGYAVARLNHYGKKAGADPYLMLVNILRGVYDIVDQAKRWEAKHSPGGAALLDEIRRELESRYQAAAGRPGTDAM